MNLRILHGSSSLSRMIETREPGGHLSVTAGLDWLAGNPRKGFGSR